MKRIIALFCILSLYVIPLAAASYENNEYQRKSRLYSAMAERAFDKGEYEQAIQYSAQAEEYARLSEEYIRTAIARSRAETELLRARTRLSWAESVNAPIFYAEEYASAQEHINAGAAALSDEDYEQTYQEAQLALVALEGVTETEALPEYFTVTAWHASRHCFWTISGYPFIYDDPLVWRKIYEANKNVLPDPNNPDLVLPNTVLKIPSLYGEYRKGTFDPKKEYPAVKKR